jgi:hypothetical protein
MPGTSAGPRGGTFSAAAGDAITFTIPASASAAAVKAVLSTTGQVAFVPLPPTSVRERVATARGEPRGGSGRRWRRLSRCYEGTEASARAWLEVASVGYLLGRA